MNLPPQMGDILALALALPDDRSLSIALTQIDSWSTSSGGSDDGGRQDWGLDDEPEQSRLNALVELAKSGDVEAFGQLYDHYHHGVYRFLYYRVCSKELAEDLMSETFIRAMKNLPSYKWQGKDFSAWLTTIARNLSIDHAKSARVRREHSFAVLPDAPTAEATPEAQAIGRLSDAQIHKLLGTLRDDQRDCVIMRFFEGLSVAETAKALGKSEGAIKQLTVRAIRNLQRAMEGEHV